MLDQRIEVNIQEEIWEYQGPGETRGDDVPNVPTTEAIYGPVGINAGETERIIGNLRTACTR